MKRINPSFDFNESVKQAVLLERQNRLDEAVKLWQKLVSIEPEESANWMRMGFLLKKLGRYAEARHAYEAAVAIDPNSSPSLMGLSSLADKEGDLEKAEEYLRLAIARTKRGQEKRFMYLDLERLLVAKKQWHKAQAALLKASFYGPDSEDVYYHLAHLYGSMGMWENALSASIKVVRMNPLHEDAYAVLLHTLDRMGKPKEAAAVKKQLRELQKKQAEMQRQWNQFIDATERKYHIPPFDFELFYPEALEK